VIGVIATVKMINFAYTKIEKIQLKQSIVVGQQISFQGEIESKNNFPLYTHKLTNTEGKTIFIKSSKNNLNKYTGEIEIYGEVKEIKHDTPVVEVQAIKFPEQGLVIKENNYLFVNDRLYLDFSSQSPLSAKKEGKEIQILYNDERIADIEFFLCSKVFKQKDCSSLVETYRTNEKENFDSYRGYTYYKQWTWLRMLLHETSFGYIFKNIEEKDILDLSNIIRIVDEEFVFENKKEIITTQCENIGKPISKSAKPRSIEYEDTIVHLTIGNDDNTECSVSLDMWNERQAI
jgi:hypothetical protein